MLPSIPETPQLVSRSSSRSLRYGLAKNKPWHLLGLMVMLLLSGKPLLAQLVSVNGAIALPATNVGSSIPQNILLKTTSAETISSFTVPVSQGNKQEYTVGAVSGCAVDGATSNPVGTVCTVAITFSPAYPGQRPVPLQAVTSTGKINIGLNGVGVSPLAVLTPGTMSTLAGEVNPPNCNAYTGPGLLGPICNPSAGAVDSAGNVYVAAYFSDTVSKIDTSGNITVIAGTGSGSLSGVGGPATSASFDRPADVVVDPAGNVYFISETAQQVFRIDGATQILTSVAGNGNAGYSGDNGPAIQASLNYPEGLALDTQGNLYIEDHNNNLVRKVDTAGTITTVAGDPATVNQSSPAYMGDGGLAIKAPLALNGNSVYASYDSIAVDAAGDLFIGDSGHHVVREVTTDGIIHTVAGNNALGAGFSGDGGAATSAQLNWPMGVAVDPAGDLYIADFSNNRIRKVGAATQTITTVVGNGSQGSADGGLATQVTLNGPQKVVIDGEGNLYVADTKNNLVRKLDVSNPTLTFATSTPADSLDTTDGPLEAIVSNIGNAPLSMPPPATGANPSISVSFTGFIGNSGPCPTEGSLSTSPGTLTQGSSCQISVEFDPVSTGTVTGSIVLTDNSLNAASPYATQTIGLVGTATAAVNTGTLSVAPTTQMFPSTAISSTSSALVSIITNTTGSPIYLSPGSLTDAVDFTQVVFCNTGILQPNGGTCTVTFTFTPQSSGPLTSTFSIHDLNHPELPLTVVLSGNGTAAPAPQPVLTPLTMDFGSLTVGTTSSAQIATLKNTGNAPLTISSFGFFGPNTGSFSETNGCNSSVAAGSSCSIMITCTPAASGSLSANLGANFPSPIPQQSIALTCNGAAAVLPQAALTPPSANFGSVTTGTSSSAQTFTLSNTGTATLGITSISLSGTNPNSFIVVNDSCATGPVLSARPANLAAHGRAIPHDNFPGLPSGLTCQVLVVFAPASAGPLTATLTVVDDAGTQTSTLTGTGVAIIPADFGITATPASQTTQSGGSVTYSISLGSLNATNPFTGTVALTATGLPAGAIATFSPASLVPGAGNSTMTVTLSPSTAHNNPTPLSPVAPISVASVMILCLTGRKRRLRVHLAMLFALGLATASLIGCSTNGTGFATPTPKPTTTTYTITVTGTSGSTVHSTTVTLSVK